MACRSARRMRACRPSRDPAIGVEHRLARARRQRRIVGRPVLDLDRAARAISTARCCASGVSEITRSNAPSSRSSKLLAWWRLRSAPISSITATAKGSSSPSSGLQAAAVDVDPVAEHQLHQPLGHRRADAVEVAGEQHRARKPRGPTAMPRSAPPVQGADQGEEPPGGVEVGLDLAGQPRRAAGPSPRCAGRGGPCPTPRSAAASRCGSRRNSSRRP